MSANQEIPIELTSRHESVTERMRSYVTEKAQKLQRFHNRISRIHVVVDGVHREPNVEMIVHVDSGATLVAKEHQEHFKSAVDLLLEKMERQLKKDNEKRKHHKGGDAASDDQDGVGTRDANDRDEAEETYDDAVRNDLSR
ncbi:MAG: ribosome-associated translation inhibitor RaiA [Planctomycetota bacterium]